MLEQFQELFCFLRYLIKLLTWHRICFFGVFGISGEWRIIRWIHDFGVAAGLSTLLLNQFEDMTTCLSAPTAVPAENKSEFPAKDAEIFQKLPDKWWCWTCLAKGAHNKRVVPAEIHNGPKVVLVHYFLNQVLLKLQCVINLVQCSADHL